jgi:hypothetical protein
MITKILKFAQKICLGIGKCCLIAASLLVLTLLVYSFVEFIGWLLKKTPLFPTNEDNFKVGIVIVFVLGLLYATIYSLAIAIVGATRWIITQWKDS